MTQPVVPQPAAPAGKDNTTLFGVLGIVIGLICCGPIGLVFAILSHIQANKHGNKPTLAIIGYVCVALGIIWNIIYAVNR
ncbi:hypothetical protein AB0H43_07145 [Hamadaea sp. NPDC050747]|uniref:hypothetical protein n=1 Tax=Hamadaea sp. NPDC050747 TaxID=3155789 RepID=UPI0033CB9E7B